MSDDGRGMDAGRHWWWAALRTERDRRLAVARGRPITSRNLGRLLGRRLSKASGVGNWLNEWQTIAGLTAGKEMNMSNQPNEVIPLTYDVLRKAVESAAAFRCRRRLQPAGGPGDKVFPPTYAGAVYAVEQRRVPGRQDPVTCVLLDSVQSQANRMEEALQHAIDEALIALPYVRVDFSKADLLDTITRVTSLEAPHRLADAILRDSESKDDKKPFRRSKAGSELNGVSNRFATPLFRLSPNTLVFGMWDSAGPKGGLGAKFERAIVSEIVAVDVLFGLKTASRIDPLQISRGAGPLYRTASGGWTLNTAEAMPGKKKGTFVLFKRNSKGEDVEYDPASGKYPEQGRPSEANHGNVTPGFAKYTKGAEGPDVLQAVDFKVNLDVDQQSGRWRTQQTYSSSTREAREGGIAPGGITCDHVEQMTTLSFIQLRRLHFPMEPNSKATAEQNLAARTMLAAIGLAGAALAFERGVDLRSRCVLFPDDPMTWELLDAPGQPLRKFNVDSQTILALLEAAAEAVIAAKLPWETAPVELTPSKQLIELVRKSQELATKNGEANGEV
ncbi:MAG: type I-U CRISPR-associated RAMP protein Csb1/Cas7u [Bacillota bacterium]